MKYTVRFKTQVFLLLAMMVVVGTMMSSCAKDEGFDQSPITGEYFTPIGDFNTKITEVALGDCIALHGTGLDVRNIDQLKINDVVVDKGEMYSEKGVLYMQVPVKLAVEVTDKVYITNSSGTIQVPLKTITPQLKLTRMFNEYVPAGDTIKIYGDFFNLYEIDSLTAKVDFGGIESKVIRSGDKFITAKVPENVSKNVKVKLISEKFNTEAVCPGRYYDKGEFVILDFDGIDPTWDPKTKYIVTDPLDKTRLSGNFLRIDMNTEYSGWWYITERKSVVAFTEDMVRNPQNYVIKCEFRTGGQLVMDKFELFCYIHWSDGTGKWDASHFKTESLNTWETLSLPLIINAEESMVPHFNSFELRLAIDAALPRNLSFDNFRVCRKDS